MTIKIIIFFIWIIGIPPITIKNKELLAEAADKGFMPSDWQYLLAILLGLVWPVVALINISRFVTKRMKK